MSEYNPTNIYIKDGFLYLDTDKGVFQVNVPHHISINEELKHKYKAVSHAHVIDENGFGLYEPRQWRPFVLLPNGLRNALQWEFDKYCYDFPDERYVGQQDYVDVNALVWKSWCKNKSTKNL